MGGPVDAVLGSRPSSYRQLIDAKIAQLPEADRNLLNYDTPKLTTSLAAVSAFVLNVSLKRSLLLYEGAVATGALCAISSGVTNFILHKSTEDSLLSDPTKCTACAVIRGGLIQGFTSSVLPLGVSFSLGAIIGDRYGSVKAPELRWKTRVEAWNFWRLKFKPVKLPFLVSFGLQAAFGCYYTYRRKTVVDRVHESVTDEEVVGVISSQLRDMEKFESYFRDW